MCVLLKGIYGHGKPKLAKVSKVAEQLVVAGKWNNGHGAKGLHFKKRSKEGSANE